MISDANQEIARVIQQNVNDLASAYAAIKVDHLEMTAAAYLRHTQIPPGEVMLVERRWDGDARIAFAYERKTPGDWRAEALRREIDMLEKRRDALRNEVPA